MGTIFRITPAGSLTTLFTFTDFSSSSTLVQGTDGAFYGGDVGGPGANFGYIFRFDVGLDPFLQLVLTIGTVGERVTILGNNLTGATEVRFNGTPATFNVLSPNAIVTTVPEDANSGPITVTLASGKLRSKVPFTVTDF